MARRTYRRKFEGREGVSGTTIVGDLKGSKRHSQSTVDQKLPARMEELT